MQHSFKVIWSLINVLKTLHHSWNIFSNILVGCSSNFLMFLLLFIFTRIFNIFFYLIFFFYFFIILVFFLFITFIIANCQSSQSSEEEKNMSGKLLSKLWKNVLPETLMQHSFKVIWSLINVLKTLHRSWNVFSNILVGCSSNFLMFFIFIYFLLEFFFFYI